MPFPGYLITLSASLSTFRLIQIPTHHDGSRFKNPSEWFESGEWDRGTFWAISKRMLSAMRTRQPFLPEGVTSPKDALPVLAPDWEDIISGESRLKCTWVGHSTYLVRLDGVFVMTDPMFSTYASALQFVGPKRMVPPAFSIEDIPQIDIVVVSHNHYDHMDKGSIARIKNRAKWVVPLRMGQFFIDQGIDKDRVQELDWWQSTVINVNGKDISVTLCPALHWSKRGIADDFKTLWGSFSIKGPQTSLWFAGDTGYNARLFPEIGNRVGPFDCALVPIGAYCPRDVMKAQHIDAREAVQVAKDIGARHALAMHWGTFELTFEPLLEPPKMFLDSCKAMGDPCQCHVLKHGQTWTLERHEKATTSE